MSLASEESRHQYTCTGVGSYAIPFYFIDDADITVYRVDSDGVATTLAIDTDYTLAGAGVPAGGTLMTVATYSNGYIVIARDVDYTQTLDLSEGDGFRAETLEQELDREVMQIQQLARKMGRAFVLSDSDTSGATTLLPKPASNRVIGWNSLATGLENVDATSLATRVQASNFTTNTFADGVDFESGVTTELELGSQPGTKANTQVYYDGVYQSKAGYSIASQTLVFTYPIVASRVEVVVILAVTQGTAVIGADAVGTTELADGSVTSVKLNSDAIALFATAAQGVLADSAMQSVPALSITSAKIAAGAVTSDKASLSYMTDVLSSNVTMTNANTYYDGPSVVLSAGTWLITSCVTCLNGAAAGDFRATAKLWDGSTVYATGESSLSNYVKLAPFPLTSIIVLGSTATLKVSVASTSTGCTILAACPNNGAGNNASTITAVRIA